MSDPKESPTVLDVDSLPPTEYLALEALAARHRLGEQSWTFPAQPRIVAAVHALARRGLVDVKSGVAPKTILAWLTDAGRSAALREGYEPPILRMIEASSLGTAEAKALRASVPDEVAAAIVARSKEFAERSDLPVGHSNGSFNDDELASVEARVRAQVAEEIAQAIEALKPSIKQFWDALDARTVYVLNDAAKKAREVGGKPSESVVAALPDTDPESDVAIAEQMLPAGADVFGMVPLSSGCRRGECALCDFGSIHAPCAHDCHVPVAALPDVVGTPETHPEG